jgi:ATP-dependent helicase HrpB
VLAFAFPDRVAQRRPGALARYQLRNGTGSVLADSPGLGTEPYLVIAETDGRSPESRIYLAAPYSIEELRADFGGQIATEEAVEWDAKFGVRAAHRESLGALTLSERPVAEPDAEAVREVLLDAVRNSSLALLTWSENARRLRERLAFVHSHDASWPDVRDTSLLAELDQWIGPHLSAVRSPADIERLDLGQLLMARIDWRQRSRLDELAPTHFTAPTGSRLPIDYSEPAGPIVRVRLQEMFGQTTTPRVMDGRVPLTFHLLSPAHRPVQVTQDLASFWRSSYFDVRRDMKGRYPKHPWPEDPLAAAPTRRRK